MTRALFPLLLLLAACTDKEPTDSTGEDTGPFDIDGDGYTAATDCDDEDAAVNPGAVEACDGVDNNCDGTADEGQGSVWFTDADGDGYGVDGTEQTACTQPASTAAQGGDCADDDALSFPGAGERCDGVDNDCDDTVDEDIQSTWYADNDGDGYGDPGAPVDSCDPGPGFVADSADCDDSRADVSPADAEVCDGADNNCDGATDEGVLSTFYLDDDNDGYGDADFPTTACAEPTGYTPDATDCDDSTSAANPGATELCDTLDNDCDGDTDEDDAADATTWYIDYDGDGYGASTYTLTQCEQPSGYVTDSTDCNDARAKTYPGAPEYCDKIDSDCDGTLDEGDALDADTWYADSDGDGYGDPGSSTTACSQPTSYVSDATDCEDGDSDAYPGSTETETPLDGIDTDCDGNDHCTDLNCDGLVDMILVAHYTGSSYSTAASLFYNTGSGLGSSPSLTLTAYGSYDTAVDDLDGDGYQDIVVANYYNGSTYSVNSAVYWGSASGYSVGDRTDLATEGATRVSTGDFNGDGWGDIAFSNYYNGSYSLNSYVYYGSSAGFSSSYRDNLATTGAWPMESADLNLDGYDDLIFACYYSGSSYSCNGAVWYGSASGFSSSNTDTLPTIGGYDIEIQDFNADGWPDIAVANYYTGSSYANNSYVYYGSSSGYSTSYRTSLPTYGAIGVASGDIDGDGRIDLVFSGYHYSSWSTNAPTLVYYNSSLGYSSSVYDSVGTRGVQFPEVADLDSDGYADIIAPQYYTGTSHTTTSYVYWGSSSGVSDSDRTSFSTIGAVMAGVADLNGDGYPEVVIPGYHAGSWSSSAYSYVWKGSASGYSSSSVTTLSAPTNGVYQAPIFVGDGSW